MTDSTTPSAPSPPAASPPAPTLSSRAVVVTDSPDRYAKQLVAHLGRKVAFSTDGPTSTAELGGGTGTVVVGDRELTLLAQAPDGDRLAVVQDVLGRHLERFGQRAELSVTWSAATSGGRP